ncbi:MAG: DUF3795 domain-containing protein [Deltaproteobacteria bacterium]|nr:DUF3795 domain-containing protein [Deltaproteobacteria bacterium]
MTQSGGRELVGICGIYCGTCPFYLAGREKDIDQLEQLSQAYDLPVEEVRCDGCRSDRVFRLCVECRHGFRTCAEEQNVAWCFQCGEFPCDRLRAFKDIHVVNDISHHEKLIENLQYIKDQGIERWLEDQKKAGKCPSCGKRLYWFVRECPDCHNRIR